MGVTSFRGFALVIAQSRYNQRLLPISIASTLVVLHNEYSAAPLLLLLLPPPVPAPPSSPPPSLKKDCPMFGVGVGVTDPQMAVSIAPA